ncbi:NAD(P)-binding protein [Hesseltinella vesiculosa]|uniref:NAD(P)-binding protein n=1 Tax=Hesseltinella vesiculosa TaxID=101127 RepID=A0A1X2GX56_9FUNG|nr:NAD(P)-binding protein [Hesseltinella vesiculosa]
MSSAVVYKQFITSPQFAVVGASTSRAKYGNKVLRWYQDNGLKVVPVHPKEGEIEGLTTVTSIDQLTLPEETAVSVITPPKVTLGVLEACKKLGVSKIWLQPGAEDSDVLKYAKEAGLDVIAGGPCILVQGPGLLAERGKL